MTISIELPNEIEQQLRRRVANLDEAAKEALLVELYRQEKLTHHQLSHALGLSRYETDGLLKRHDVLDNSSLDDVLRDASVSRHARSQ